MFYARITDYPDSLSQVKVAAEQSILREKMACDIQMAFRRHRVRQRCQLRLKTQAKKEREAVRRIERA